MSVKYFLRNTTVDATCDLGGSSDLDADLNQTQGSDSDATGISSNTSYEDILSFDVDVSGDTPDDGDMEVSIDITAISNPECNVRFYVEAIDDAGCTVEQSVTPIVQQTTGVKTFTFSGFVWPVAAERLRLRVQLQRTLLHGNKTVTIDCSSVDSFVNAVGFGSAPAANPHYYMSNLIGSP